MLMQKAQEFGDKLCTKFTPSAGWLSRWKNRAGIKFKRAHGEKSSANLEAAEEWLSSKMPELLESFNEDTIYNADETGLFYRAAPDSSLCFSTETLSGSKKAMDRITVLVCANMSGSDKKKLLVIGKSKNPRCFKNISKLPVIYRSNQRAWMTSILFAEWLNEWNKELSRESKKILLLVDNCSAHPHVPLSNNSGVLAPKHHIRHPAHGPRCQQKFEGELQKGTHSDDSFSH